MSLNNNLRELRKTKGISLDKAAKELQISAAALSNYERGTRIPDAVFLQRASDYYSVGLERLLDKHQFEILSEEPRKVLKFSDKQFLDIPVLSPLESKSVADHHIVLDLDITNISKDDDVFFWRINQENMEPKFQKGDLVLIKRQSQVNDGDDTLIKRGHDGQYVLSRVYGAGQGYKFLINANPNCPPERVPLRELNIVGKAILRIG